MELLLGFWDTVSAKRQAAAVAADDDNMTSFEPPLQSKILFHEWLACALWSKQELFCPISWLGDAVHCLLWISMVTTHIHTRITPFVWVGGGGFPSSREQ